MSMTNVMIEGKCFYVLKFGYRKRIAARWWCAEVKYQRKIFSWDPPVRGQSDSQDRLQQLWHAKNDESIPVHRPQARRSKQDLTGHLFLRASENQGDLRVAAAPRRGIKANRTRDFKTTWWDDARNRRTTQAVDLKARSRTGKSRNVAQRVPERVRKIYFLKGKRQATSVDQPTALVADRRDWQSALVQNAATVDGFETWLLAEDSWRILEAIGSDGWGQETGWNVNNVRDWKDWKT